MFKQTMATTLAFVLLFSTMSFHVDMHFCGDHLVDFSFTKKAATCGLELSKAEGTVVCAMAAMQCCTDEVFVVEGQDELLAAADACSPEQQSVSFISYFPRPASPVACLPMEAENRFQEYSPPPLIRRVHLLHESFLI